MSQMIAEFLGRTDRDRALVDQRPHRARREVVDAKAGPRGRRDRADIGGAHAPEAEKADGGAIDTSESGVCGGRSTRAMPFSDGKHGEHQRVVAGNQSGRASRRARSSARCWARAQSSLVDEDRKGQLAG